MNALRRLVSLICVCAATGVDFEVSLASDRTAQPRRPGLSVGIPKPPSGGQPFSCGSISGVCYCTGKKDCEFMGSSGACEAPPACFPIGGGLQECWCRAKGFTAPPP